jgi:hypothetical protein
MAARLNTIVAIAMLALYDEFDTYWQNGGYKKISDIIFAEWHIFIVSNLWHNYGQYLTTPSRTHSNNHFASFYSLILNITIVGENSVLRMPKTPMNAEMCFCACVYMKSVRTTIIRQSNSIQNRKHTTRDSLVKTLTMVLQTNTMICREISD